MTSPWLPPNINPLTRLSVADGLLIDAERWQLAHNYHHQRQNAHFQSLNQPGIVSDMGVLLIDPPDDIPSQYRDGRWLQIQPGIAIDLFGNLIVIPEPVDFRIISEVVGNRPQPVYIVASYVDPDHLTASNNGHRDIVTETFRIDEKNTPPAEWEVELARISLTQDPVTLAIASNVCFPQANQLDLRYRPQARSRSQATVHLAQILLNSPEDEQIHSDLTYLNQAIAALYSPWQGSDNVRQFNLNTAIDIREMIAYDILFLKSYPSRSLTPQTMYSLQQYIAMGGVLVVERVIEGEKVEELMELQQQLYEAIARLNKMISLAPTADNQEFLTDQMQIKQSLQEELVAVEETLHQEIRTLATEFQTLAEWSGETLKDITELSPHHPLKTQPFLFSALPSIQDKPLKLFLSNGIILIIGDLSPAWGINRHLCLPRETIRTAQEMGINIVHYAHQRRTLTQLQKSTIPETYHPVNSLDSFPP